MKTVLITGAAGGLGLCLCREYLARGYRVFGWGATLRTGMQALLTKEPQRVSFRVVDVGDTSSVQAGAAWLAEHCEHLDTLINGAAILPENSANPLEQFDIDAAADVFNINSLGPLRVVKAVLPLLKRGGEKAVVNISSEAGSMTTHCGYTNRYDYCMSKAALNIQSIILQRYLEPDGVKVLLIHPGWMHTSMGGEQAPLAPEESAAGIARLASQCRALDGMYMDYNGAPRAW